MVKPYTTTGWETYNSACYFILFSFLHVLHVKSHCLNNSAFSIRETVSGHEQCTPTSKCVEALIFSNSSSSY